MNRSLVIDLLKIAAAQAIVWHHWSVYGPMAQAMHQAWPIGADQFLEISRLAVQVFLVMGGFLAGQAIRLDTPTPAPEQVRHWITRRYLRLMPPYLIALLLITALAWMCRDHLSGDWLVAPPTWSAALAHVLTLQNLFGLPALSVGVWYVAIDFQLYVLLILLLAAARSPRKLSGWVLGLSAASMLCFNLHSQLDNWVLYFFGAYGLGLMAAWSLRSLHDARLFVLALVTALLALWLEPRIRLETALITAVVLSSTVQWRTPVNAWGQWMRHLADSSFGVFLTHYGVLILVSTVWEIFGWQGLGHALGIAVLACLLSVGAGLAFFRWVEQPLSTWLQTWQEQRRVNAMRLRATVHSAMHTMPTHTPWPPSTHTPQTSPRLR